MMTKSLLGAALLLLATLASEPVTANPVDDLRETVDPLVYCIGSGEGENCPQVCGGGAGTCVDNACDNLGGCGPGTVQFLVDTACDADCQETVQDVLEFVDESDQDNDNIPDAVESEMCGRPAIRGQVDGSTVPGRCMSTTDYNRNG